MRKTTSPMSDSEIVTIHIKVGIKGSGIPHVTRVLGAKADTTIAVAGAFHKVVYREKKKTQS